MALRISREQPLKDLSGEKWQGFFGFHHHTFRIWLMAERALEPLREESLNGMYLIVWTLK
jgi:hypothetical protein